MKNQLLQFICFSIIFSCIGINASADNYRTISSREGLINSAILSINQDKDGFLWLGTSEGLSRWNGIKMANFPLEGHSNTNTTGNLIEEIIETTDGRLWVRSNYGLDLIEDGEITERHTEFSGQFAVISRSTEETLVLTKGRRLFGYNSLSSEFARIDTPRAISYQGYLASSFSTSSGTTWVALRTGIYELVTGVENGICTIKSFESHLKGDFASAYSGHEELLILDEEGTILAFNITTGEIERLACIKKIIDRRGKVSSIIRKSDNLYVSFLLDGVVQVKMDKDAPDGFTVKDLEINCGVFGLFEDKKQDLIWIGTDGQGLIGYTEGNISFRSFHSRDLPFSLTKMVRGIYLDSTGNLWIGTKGEGIIKIDNFDGNSKQNWGRISRWSQGGDDRLSSTYCFTESRNGILWIGSSDNGLNYYDRRDDKIHHVADGRLDGIAHVHRIHEDENNGLWVATVGYGVFHISLSYASGTPLVTSVEQLDFGEDFKDNTYFFSMFRDNDGTLWFGNRGRGVIHYFPSDGTSINFQFRNEGEILTNDIWDIYRDGDSPLWLATSNGVIGIDDNGHIIKRVLNCKVHGIMTENENVLWLTTSAGLVRYDTVQNTTVTYGYDYGLETVQFCDDSVFKNIGGRGMIGGCVNGFVVIHDSGESSGQYMPESILRSCRINDRTYLAKDAPFKKGALRLGNGMRLNTMTFYALDYIDGSNYRYQYRLDGGKWTDTGIDIYFSGLGRGRHRIETKYINPLTNTESPVTTTSIIVSPHPLASIAAFIIYAAVIVILGFLFTYEVKTRRARKRMQMMEKIEDRRREESASAQIRLMENISRQFGVPISMISIPAMQIADNKRLDENTRSLGRQILSQSDTMRSLLQTLNDFRSSDEVVAKAAPKLFQIDDLVAKLLTQKNGSSKATCRYSGRTIWYGLPKDIATVIEQIYGLANSHCSDTGKISLVADGGEEYNTITLSVSEGSIDLIHQDELTDTRKAMEHFLKIESSGFNFQDEMKFALCANIAKRLDGSISLTNMEKGFEFAFSFPAATPSDSPEEMEETCIKDLEVFEVPDTSKKLMFICGKNQELNWMISSMFFDEFEICIYLSPDELKEIASNRTPDIIIAAGSQTDREMDFKKTRQLSGIPFLLISTEDADGEEMVQCDATISLPIDARILKSTAHQVIKRYDSLKDYYSSEVSIYEFCEGKELHKDDKKFLEKVFRVISDHISDPDLDIPFVAAEIGMSQRSLYNKLRQLTSTSPSEIVRNYRVSYAEQLLSRSKLSIEEIIYRSGFTNRGTFFRNFAAKNGCTPKQFRQARSQNGIR